MKMRKWDQEQRNFHLAMHFIWVLARDEDDQLILSLAPRNVSRRRDREVRKKSGKQRKGERRSCSSLWSRRKREGNGMTRNGRNNVRKQVEWKEKLHKWASPIKASDSYSNLCASQCAAPKRLMRRWSVRLAAPEMSTNASPCVPSRKASWLASVDCSRRHIWMVRVRTDATVMFLHGHQLLQLMLANHNLLLEVQSPLSSAAADRTADTAAHRHSQ